MNIIVMGVLLLTSQPIWAQKSISANQLLKTIVESKKSKIIAKTNKRLQNKQFHKGVFFLGEIPKVQRFSKQLSSFKPRVVASSKGFTIIIQEKTHINLEIVDILTGKIKIADQEVQLKEGMSYLQVAQALARPIFKSLNIHRKTSQSPFSLIPSAYADEAFKVSKNNAQQMVGATAASFGYLAASLGTVLLLGGKIATAGTVATVAGGIVIASLGAIAGTIVMGFVGHQLTMILSQKDDKTIEEVQRYFDGMLYSCQRKKDLYFKNGRVKAGLGSQDFKDFQQLWLISHRLHSQTLSCYKLTEEKELDYYSDRHDFAFLEKLYHGPSRHLFQRRLRPLCESYTKIVNCFSNAPSPFGEKVDTEKLSINQELRGSHFFDFYRSLRENLDIQGVLP